MDALVRSDNSTRLITHFALWHGPACPLNHACVIAIRHEADFLAIRLLCDANTNTLRQSANHRLFEPCKWQLQHFDRFRVRAIKIVSLVAAQVFGSREGAMTVIVDKPSIMTSRQSRSQGFCGLKQVSELDFMVAGKARNGRST